MLLGVAAVDAPSRTIMVTRTRFGITTHLPLVRYRSLQSCRRSSCFSDWRSRSRGTCACEGQPEDEARVHKGRPRNEPFAEDLLLDPLRQRQTIPTLRLHFPPLPRPSRDDGEEAGGGSHAMVVVVAVLFVNTSVSCAARYARPAQPVAVRAEADPLLRDLRPAH
jgi:hypothetical protein